MHTYISEELGNRISPLGPALRLNDEDVEAQGLALAIPDATETGSAKTQGLKLNYIGSIWCNPGGQRKDHGCAWCCRR